MIKTFIATSILSISFLVIPNVAEAQSSKFFVELGIAHHRNTNGDETTKENFTKSNGTGILPVIGYFINNRISLGAEYIHDKSKYNTYYTEGNPNYMILVNNSLEYSSNSFGIFSRLYAKNYTSRFNAFIQLKPAILRNKSIDIAKRMESNPQEYIVQNVQQSQSISNSKRYEIDLGIGLSYKIYRGLAAQFNVPSIINHTSVKYDHTNTKQNYTSILMNTLNSSYISFNYQF